MSEPKVKALKASTFSKAQLLQSGKLNRDVLAAVLEDGKRYSVAEAKRLTDAFLKKEAK